MSKHALLIDITSIQKFIFASNKLRENLGASHLVSNLFKDTVIPISPQPIKNENGYDGYIGGGNALFFFDTDDKAQKFVEEWTKSLLVLVPGITAATAINKWDDQNFIKSRDDLFDMLIENKSKFIPQTIIPRHGISAECSSDGYSMDFWSNEYVSAATSAKLEAYEKAKDAISKEYGNIIGNYRFTGDLEMLGQSKGSENHIAIVHIDGNSMGDRFKSLPSLDATKQLSGDVENAVKNSFKKLLQKIVVELNDPAKKKFLSLKQDSDKFILPIRPIILGGDDITFVCEGRMGIYYAKIFMEAFKDQLGSDVNCLNLTSCAGVAITKTKYPFYKGYQLAEELCANAKSKRRENGNDGSWLDFHIAYGGFSGELNEIRDTHYKAQLGSLIYRPYKIADSSDYSFEVFVERTKVLKKDWPNNKIKELREVLTLGKDAVNIFLNETKSRGLKLPDVNSKKYNEKIFVGDVTPYFDMIELLEYYPKYELEE